MSMLIAVLSIALAGIILAFIILPSISLKSSPLVTYQAAMPEDVRVDQKRMDTQVQRNPSAPSSAMAKVVASTAPSPVAVPVPEVSAGPLRILPRIRFEGSALSLAILSQTLQGPNAPEFDPCGPSRPIQTVRFAFPCPYEPTWHALPFWSEMRRLRKIILTDPPRPSYLTSSAGCWPT